MSNEKSNSVAVTEIIILTVSQLGKKLDSVNSDIGGIIASVDTGNLDADTELSNRLVQTQANLAVISSGIRSLEGVIRKELAPGVVLTQKERAGVDEAINKLVDDVSRRGGRASLSLKDALSAETLQRIESGKAPETKTHTRSKAILDKFNLTRKIELIQDSNNVVHKALSENILNRLISCLDNALDPAKQSPFRILIENNYSPTRIASGAAYTECYTGKFDSEGKYQQEGLYGFNPECKTFDTFVIETERFIIRINLEDDVNIYNVVEIAAKYTATFKNKNTILWLTNEDIPAQIQQALVEDIRNRINGLMVSE